jgi:hypothetical protein
MKTGIELITEERWEQVYKHGWSRDSDVKHHFGELAKYAAALAVIGTDAQIVENGEEFEDVWDLVDKHKDPKDRIHSLKVAGALIAAEIDRLQNIQL